MKPQHSGLEPSDHSLQNLLNEIPSEGEFQQSSGIHRTSVTSVSVCSVDTHGCVDSTPTRY